MVTGKAERTGVTVVPEILGDGLVRKDTDTWIPGSGYISREWVDLILKNGIICDSALR